MAWSALQTEPAAAELIFLRAGWPPVLRALADHLVIDGGYLAHATVCADPDQAIAHIAANGGAGRARPGSARLERAFQAERAGGLPEHHSSHRHRGTHGHHLAGRRAR